VPILRCEITTLRFDRDLGLAHWSHFQADLQPAASHVSRLGLVRGLDSLEKGEIPKTVVSLDAQTRIRIGGSELGRTRTFRYQMGI